MINAETLRQSIVRVAKFRSVELTSLKAVLAGYAEIGQRRWLSWLEKQKMDSLVPKEFVTVVAAVTLFADPIVEGSVIAGDWSPADQRWA